MYLYALCSLTLLLEILLFVAVVVVLVVDAGVAAVAVVKFELPVVDTLFFWPKSS